VLNPLNTLQKHLETPNKLIEKRNDKLLDYEFAKSNIEKLNDKNILRQNLNNLVEAQQNFEALNSQLVEDLPKLTMSCAAIFDKCFKIYANAMKSIHNRCYKDFGSIIQKVKIDNLYFISFFIFKLSKLIVIFKYLVCV
jgi:hypothetical protein